MLLVPSHSAERLLLNQYRYSPHRPAIISSMNEIRSLIFHNRSYSCSNYKYQTVFNYRNVVNHQYSSYIPTEESNNTKNKLEFKPKQNRVWTIPNSLCVARIIASPALCYYILNSNYDVAMAILLLAGFSDFIDGQIARRFPNQASKIGTFLDPLADKVLIVSLYSVLTYTGAVPGILTMLIVFRDMLLLAAGFYIRYLSLSSPKTLKKFFDGSHSSAELKPTYSSKVNTVLQLVVAAISLYAPNITTFSPSALEYLWYTAGCSTIISGISYIIRRKKTYSITRK